MFPLFRRNFSTRAKALSGADILVVSIPKSGRTWLRTFLCAYFCRRAGHAMTLDPEQYGDPQIPRIVYTHDLFEQRTKGSVWDKLRGKYLIPRAELRRARIVLLARDPRDAFVSLYVQLTRRTRETPTDVKRKTAGELLRDSRYGIQAIIRIMNGWLQDFSRRDGFVLVRYESLHADPARHFRELLATIDPAPIDAAAFSHALDFSHFDNMKNLEAAGAFRSKILQAGDVEDPESFKVRRGKVGGYQEYLLADDQAYARQAMRALDQRFGYEA